jgi:hypothetical protein
LEVVHLPRDESGEVTDDFPLLHQGHDHIRCIFDRHFAQEVHSLVVETKRFHDL